MRKILFFICLVVSFNLFGQVPTGFQYRRVNERIQGKFMVDSFFYLPRFTDTTQANLHKSIDTCGAMFFSYSKDSIYFRACNPKRWITIGSGSGGGLGTLDTLLPRSALFDVVQDAGGTSYKSHRQIVYNVKDYGATGDGVTDDQPAIQRAVDSCASQGGGVVYFPNGIYSLTSTTQASIHILIPLSAVSNTDTAITIEFRGETPPMMWTNPLTDTNNSKPPLTGVILKSTSLSSTAILASNYDAHSQANFTNVVVNNIGFRVRSKTGATNVSPQGVAIDGSKLAMLTVDFCRFDTESPRDSTVMPTSGCVAIYFPRVNNWCQNIFTNSLITGYYKALVVAEHFKSNNCELDGNYIGLNTYGETQYHPVEIAQMGFWRNAYNIKLEGSGRIGITYAIFEDLTTGTDWFKNVVDLDEGNPGAWSGDIGFVKTISFSGPFDLMTRAFFGGSFITTHPMTAPVQTIGYGRGLQQDLDSTASGESYMDYKTFDGNFLRVGKVGPTYAGFLSLAANNSYISSASSDLMLETGGSKIKIGIGNFTQTHEINSAGFKYSSSTFGWFGGTVAGPIPGVWLGAPADAPTGANYNLALSSGLTLLSGPSGLHLETGNDINNGLLFDANKRLGIGFAYNGTPTASLHIRAGTTSASGGQLKFTNGSLPTTPEIGLMNFKDGLFYGDSSNSVRDTFAMRRWVRDRIAEGGGGSTPTLQQVTTAGNTTTTLIQANGGLLSFDTNIGSVNTISGRQAILSNGQLVQQNASSWQATLNADVLTAHRTFSLPDRTGTAQTATQGADVASVAGAISLGNDGNVFEITGTNAITRISSVGWQNGAEITLIFTSTASLTDGTANSGTDIGMELAGNGNFSATADDTITLILCEIGGVVRWREKCRSVN